MLLNKVHSTITFRFSNSFNALVAVPISRTHTIIKIAYKEIIKCTRRQILLTTHTYSVFGHRHGRFTTKSLSKPEDKGQVPTLQHDIIHIPQNLCIV